MDKIIRDGKEVNIYQYTQEFNDELISNGPDDFDDITFVIVQGMTDTEFEWDFFKKQLRIIYSNYNNFYENVTFENFREPEVINISDYIVKENGIYHIETEEQFKSK